ncbi:3'-5' exonuclease [Paramarasmius palmivorus]|uniref:RNA exonuclease 4 n=1 Tax=Paramarasmius palmivorus TaxID=297713 RepID=A0AAW0C2E7_9AGAR
MSKTTTIPSANWLALQKKLSKKPDATPGPAKKKRRLSQETRTKTTEVSSFPRGHENTAGPSKIQESISDKNDLKNGESLSALRKMISGDVNYTEAQKLPGKYLALDCEMVGVGIDGSESSLARVTLVNYYGAVQLDEFVKQRERVVDYRTQYSGIRESDMVKAKPFDEVQKKVADLLKDRILIGHAVHNDVKVLLLSHPRPLTRDTQYFAGKHKVVRSKYVALRNLVKQELDVTIQSGEHSSLTDARATMAVYRLHKKEWEKGAVGVASAMLLKSKKESGKNHDPSEDVSTKAQGKRKLEVDDLDDEHSDSSSGDEEDEDEIAESSHHGRSQAQIEHKKAFKSVKVAKALKKTSKSEKRAKTFPGGGRKGVSSGLSTVVHQGRRVKKGGSYGGPGGGQWWRELGN